MAEHKFYRVIEHTLSNRNSKTDCPIFMLTRSSACDPFEMPPIAVSLERVTLDAAAKIHNALLAAEIALARRVGAEEAVTAITSEIVGRVAGTQNEGAAK